MASGPTFLGRRDGPFVTGQAMGFCLSAGLQGIERGCGRIESAGSMSKPKPTFDELNWLAVHRFLGVVSSSRLAHARMPEVVSPGYSHLWPARAALITSVKAFLQPTLYNTERAYIYIYIYLLLLLLLFTYTNIRTEIQVHIGK